MTNMDRIADQRVRTHADLTKCTGNSEPHYGGMLGTIIELSDRILIIRLDDHRPELEEWDNELVWTSDDLDDAETMEQLLTKVADRIDCNPDAPRIGCEVA